MEKKILNNGVEMPMLGLGTYLSKDLDLCQEICERALEIGYRHIDTAQMYGNEEAVGKAVEVSQVSRSEVFITTKISHKRYSDAYESVLESMKRLRTDYIDLVLLHWPFADTYKAWRDLERLYAEGAVRAIGVSNYNADRLVDLIGYNNVVPAVDQVETNLTCQQRENRKWMDTYGVAHESYAPFGQGRMDEIYEDKVLLEISSRYNKTPRQITLRFLLQEGVICIPKTVHAERLSENFDVFGFTLTEKEMEALRSFDKASPLIGNPERPERVLKALAW